MGGGRERKGGGSEEGRGGGEGVVGGNLVWAFTMDACALVDVSCEAGYGAGGGRGGRHGLVWLSMYVGCVADVCEAGVWEN